MNTSRGRIICNGMLRINTPLEDYRQKWGLWVKREDLACPPPGPPFSKTRGVYARVLSRKENLIGVLDTFHSQAGWAVSRACEVLGKTCLNFYPLYKRDTGLRMPQQKAKELGASLYPLSAGRSCILYHSAKKEVESRGGYMMPNALKLEESVTETAAEASSLTSSLGGIQTVLIAASSGTIAAGVIRGLGADKRYLIHMGYSRSQETIRSYLLDQSGVSAEVELIDEGYSYKDEAKPGATPDWPCNSYYDLKAFRWWVRFGRDRYGKCLFWNIG